MSGDQLRRLRKARQSSRVYYINENTGLLHSVIDITRHGLVRVHNPDGIFGSIDAIEKPITQFVKVIRI